VVLAGRVPWPTDTRTISGRRDLELNRFSLVPSCCHLGGRRHTPPSRTIIRPAMAAGTRGSRNYTTIEEWTSEVPRWRFLRRRQLKREIEEIIHDDQQLWERYQEMHKELSAWNLLERAQRPSFSAVRSSRPPPCGWTALNDDGQLGDRAPERNAAGPRWGRSPVVAHGQPRSTADSRFRSSVAISAVMRLPCRIWHARGQPVGFA
jgi:hypothetical protein